LESDWQYYMVLRFDSPFGVAIAMLASLLLNAKSKARDFSGPCIFAYGCVKRCGRYGLAMGV
jgi:hypothetical protein